MNHGMNLKDSAQKQVMIHLGKVDSTLNIGDFFGFKDSIWKKPIGLRTQQSAKEQIPCKGTKLTETRDSTY